MIQASFEESDEDEDMEIEGEPENQPQEDTPAISLHVRAPKTANMGSLFVIRWWCWLILAVYDMVLDTQWLRTLGPIQEAEIIQNLLHSYEKIINELECLPPTRSRDHRITLLPRQGRLR
ncbi:hypothetical protein JRO89_XS01G0089100 [Xanthoceras sorbifolium]|uniref:Uncharacterized protein n=1 Tax=Xanthoceras sorbifolium TaxID=99658 RepID=A0ABQ8IIM5_9ROSI|nr:hypothetical protein JRO89_XS01G0089100 [Xanthoceras sorbifolium]